ncbi:PAS domain-containing protein [Methanoregula sp.]|uniref:PAS domain-containing protein n=1 Tax=Methanoregula sp. TaxID=2052170 RepID=UPI002C0CCA2C|nr:PAS domain-containing protein [Methanoregula sp.]HVP97141.1 PAS domain-containing protein [Methanoregula sp.]
MVFDRIQTGILIIDPETHTISDVNNHAESLLGVTKDNLIGKVCHDFVCPAHCGQCPITDLHTPLHNAEWALITPGGEKIPILKTVANATLEGKEYLIESFVDIRDRKKAEDRRIALISYLNESVLRVKKPLELTGKNLLDIEQQLGSGDYSPEDIRLQIRLQANNIITMAATLQELADKAAEEREDIPERFREFFIGK